MELRFNDVVEMTGGTDTKPQRLKAMLRLTYWMIKIAVIAKSSFNESVGVSSNV